MTLSVKSFDISFGFKSPGTIPGTTTRTEYGVISGKATATLTVTASALPMVGTALEKVPLARNIELTGFVADPTKLFSADPLHGVSSKKPGIKVDVFTHGTAGVLVGGSISTEGEVGVRTGVGTTDYNAYVEFNADFDFSPGANPNAGKYYSVDADPKGIFREGFSPVQGVETIHGFDKHYGYDPRGADPVNWGYDSPAVNPGRGNLPGGKVIDSNIGSAKVGQDPDGYGSPIGERGKDYDSSVGPGRGTSPGGKTVTPEAVSAPSPISVSGPDRVKDSAKRYGISSTQVDAARRDIDVNGPEQKVVDLTPAPLIDGWYINYVNYGITPTTYGFTGIVEPDGSTRSGFDAARDAIARGGTVKDAKRAAYNSGLNSSDIKDVVRVEAAIRDAVSSRGGEGNGSARGGTSERSAAEANAGYSDTSMGGRGAMSVPVLLDLDGDGISITELTQSTVFVDTDNDGLQNRTAWAGAGDAVLFYDPDGHNTIIESRQFIFTEWDPTAQGDLEAIRSVFDSNGDGKLTAADAAFADFKLMAA